MSVYFADPDVTLYHGDALGVLRELPDESVDCCTTSPPYWGLRDYGHPDQIGLEPTPNGYITSLIQVFAEVRRVLTAGGTLWLNLGDGYAQGSKGNSGEIRPGDKQGTNTGSLATRRGSKIGPKRTGGTNGFCKPKDLLGMPWRVAFALQDDGWWLRSAITWCKPNPMPESVTDRPTKGTEMVFMLSRSPRYYFGQDDLREPYSYDGRKILEIHGTSEAGHANYANREGKSRWPGLSAAAAAARREVKEGGHVESEPMEITHAGRNIRDYWLIAPEPYPEAHFAVFPQELARRMILGGCPPGGTVLDPFGGSGTTARVARKLERRSILIELNESYCEMASRRLSQQSLLAAASFQDTRGDG